jgi:hypothetical protein
MANAEYWRVHEEEYRAMARSCSSTDGRHVWTVLAEQCAAMAIQIDALGALRADVSGVARPSQKPVAA